MARTGQDVLMAGKKPRGRETSYDMVLSMGTVLVVVAVILFITWRPKHQMMPTVDYQGAVSQAVAGQVWPILVPSTIPAGWTPTNARFEPETYGATGDVRWYLGFKTQNNQYVSLWQSNGPAGKVTAAATNSGECLPAAVSINGVVWHECEQTQPLTHSLVQTEGKVTTIVSGTADLQTLTSFASSLVPAKH